MATIYLGAGVQLGAGVKVGVSGGSTPLSSANIYYPMQDIIGSAANGSSVPVLTNYGTDSLTYDATAVGGYTQPTVATVGGYKVLSIQGYTQNQLGYNLSTAFDCSTNASLFMVGWNTITDYAYARAVAFGGQAGTYQRCFFGVGISSDNSSYLLRDTNDNGMTLTGLSPLSGLKAFGIVKTGTSIVYYDNNTTPVSWPGTASGTYAFNTVGWRYFGGAGFTPQPTTGYLGDMAWFSTALDSTSAGNVMTYLKNTYGIV